MRRGRRYGWSRRSWLLGTAAMASERRVLDADDTKGPLDIAWVQHGHRQSPAGVRQLVHTVRLFDPWPVRRLRHRGFVHLFLDVEGHRSLREERAVWITYRKGRLRAQLMHYSAEPPTVMRRVPLWRPDRRTLKIAFRKRALGRGRFEAYGWSAISFVEERDSSCDRRGGCHDSAPEAGYVRHRL